MSDEILHRGAESVKPTPRRHPFLVALGVLLVIEAAVMIVVLLVLIGDLVTQQAAQFSSAVALTVLAAIGTVFVCAVAVAALRLQVWSRGAALIWQVILLAVGFGMFQGATARFDLALLFLVPALVGIFLLLSKPVTAVLRHANPYETHL